MSEKNHRHVSRRTFFFMSGAAALVGCARTARKPSTRISALERLNVAGVGCGGQAFGDLNDIIRDQENCVPCRIPTGSVQERFSEWRCREIPHYREMLDKEHKNIDAVVVACPDHMHTPAALAAMELGKHVYVEKPLTRTIYEADLLLKAARRYKVATQMGNQGHSGDGVRQMCEAVWAGLAGDITEVHIWTNRPVWPQGIAEPLPEQPVRNMTDLGSRGPIGPTTRTTRRSLAGWWIRAAAHSANGCHTDPPWPGLERRRVSSASSRKVRTNRPAQIKLWSSMNFRSASTSTLRSTSGNRSRCRRWWCTGMKGNGSRSALRLCLPTRCWAISGTRARMGLFLWEPKDCLLPGATADTRLVPASAMESQKEVFANLEKIIPRIETPGGHRRDWVRACKDGKPSASEFEYSVPLTKTVVLGNLAMQTGEKVYWDAANEKVTNNVPGVEALIKPAYRAPYKLG